MRRRDFERLSRSYLEPCLAGYVTIQGLLLRQETEWVLTGLLFESSSYLAERFDVTAIAQPLYVPAEHLVLDGGFRLRGRTGVWEIHPGTEEAVMGELCEAAVAEALPFMEAASTPGGLAQWIQRNQTPTRNPNTWERLAYSLILADRMPDAERALRRARETSREGLGRRLELIAGLLETSRAEAVAQLARWRRETLGNLGLELDGGLIVTAG